jgi:hypothetical protein
MSNTAGLSALLLLALAGGFAFATIYQRTRYQILRAEGQQIFLYAALYAVVLVLVSRLSLWIGSGIIPNNAEKRIGEIWGDFLGPLNIPAFTTCLGAFVLGVLGAWLCNSLIDRDKTARKVIEEHGGQLTEFLYDSMLEARLLFVAFDNRKVYVGWPSLLPIVKPSRKGFEEHFGLLPVRSGYLSEKSLKPVFTTQYGPIYERIIELEESDSPDPNDPVAGLSVADFQIMVPIDKISVIRRFSLDVDEKLFKLSPRRASSSSE